MLLTCLEDIAQNYHGYYCFLCIPEIGTIVPFLPFQKSWPQNKPHLTAQEFCRLVVGKEASTLSTLYGIANCVKNGQQEKLYSPTDVNVPLQCHPQLLLDRFENLVHSIFRNENSTMEINVSFLGVLHWQQWQPMASAPGL